MADIDLVDLKSSYKHIILMVVSIDMYFKIGPWGLMVSDI